TRSNGINLEEDDSDLHHDDDGVSEKENGISSIRFSKRVHKLIECMFKVVNIKLLGRRLGFNSLFNKIQALWKSIVTFQLTNLENDYYQILGYGRLYKSASRRKRWSIGDKMNW
ncbi:hypothetical protein Gotri_011345, partial [Gossypium trilobum]|nr:hypothetical protein [Gossypium trilobum]